MFSLFHKMGNIQCSVSTEHYHWFTNPDPDSAIFFSDFQDVNRKVVFCFQFFCLFLTKDSTVDIFTPVFKHNKLKTQNCRNQGFSSFLLLVDGISTDPEHRKYHDLVLLKKHDISLKFSMLFFE